MSLVQDKDFYYLLLINPEMKDIKSSAYENIIYLTYLSKNVTSITVEDIVSMGNSFGYVKLSRALLLDTLDKLVSRHILSPDESGNYLIDEEFFKQLSTNKKNLLEKQRKFREYLVLLIQNSYKNPFTESERLQIIDVMMKIFERIMDSYSDAVVSFYNSKSSKPFLENLRTIVSDVVHNSEVTFEKEYFIKVLYYELKHQLLEPADVFSEGLRQFAMQYILHKMILVNPSMRSVRKELLSEAKIFLDCNVIISLLIPDNVKAEMLYFMLKEMQKLKIPIIISSRTENELFRSIDHSKHLYKMIMKGKRR